MDNFDWNQFLLSEHDSHKRIGAEDALSQKEDDVPSSFIESSNQVDEESDSSNSSESIFPELKLLGFYNKKKQNMYPEELEKATANRLCMLLHNSFCDIKEKFNLDDQITQMFSGAVWIFRDSASNLYGYFPKKNIARITNVVYNKKNFIKADASYNFWFKPGDSFYARYEQFQAEMNLHNSAIRKRRMPRYNTKVSMEDRSNGVKDEFGVLFSKDGTRILDTPNDLEYYTVPEGVKVICYDAFFRSSIKKIELSSTLECIGWNAFYGCENLQEIKLPSGLRRIEGEAFHGCTALQELHIPKNVTFIGPNPIRDCYPIKLKCDSPYFVIEDETLYDHEKQILISYWGSNEEIVIPESVKGIGRSAFSFCSSLKRVVFSSNTAIVGSNAFYYCKNLEEVIMNSSLEYLDGHSFCGCEKLKKIVLSPNLTFISSSTFCECGSLKELTIPKNVTEIGSSAFSYCTSLQNIVLPRNLIKINDKAFQSCKSLKKVIFPSNIKNISEKAFRYCENLSEIIFMGEIPQIGDRAFLGCYIENVHVNKIHGSCMKGVFPHAIISVDL